MKNFLSIIAIAMSFCVNAQTAFHNFGNIKMHQGANIGFHTDMVNDGDFANDNQGLAGFYSQNEIRTVSGNNRAVFENVDIDAINDIELYTSMGVTNDLSFINGKVFTPRIGTNVTLDLLNHNIYAGEDNLRHVDGYVSVIGSNEFKFPIGDYNRIRTMSISTDFIAVEYIGAYYFTDPNTPPSHFPEAFPTLRKQIFIDKISDVEFWDLDGAERTYVTLTWDANSNIPYLNEDISKLRVVGWSKTQGQWIDLGQSSVTGDVASGQLTSKQFVPDDYEAITIGSEFSSSDLSNVNIIFTPNGDSDNETLVFDVLEQYDNNSLSIYNRWGNIVYQTTDYQNDWTGYSEGRATIEKKKDLPVGTYFYTLEYGNENKLDRNVRGWIYIQR